MTHHKNSRISSSLRILLLAVLWMNASIASQAFAQQGCNSKQAEGQERGTNTAKQGPDPGMAKSLPEIKTNCKDSAKDPEAEVNRVASLKDVFRQLPRDQKAIWLSPFHVKTADLSWLVPLTITSAGLIGSDQHTMERARSNAHAVHLSNNVSNYGLTALAGFPALMYVWGGVNDLPRAKETGLLTGEALINSLAINETFKVITARERPTMTDGEGRFLQTVSNSSFPSSHAMLGWTAASVLAHEYPNLYIQTLAYGAAAAISIARVTGRKHFPSDVVVGAAMGWLIGRHVYRAHHDENLDDPESVRFRSVPGEIDPEKLGSVFVPLDSWVYPELKRLAAMGYIHTQFTGLQPWTRRECLRQLEEADYYAQDLPSTSEMAQLIRVLKTEVSDSAPYYRSVRLESIYTRYMNISGPVVNDSYHFGQTVINDYGRPYGQGGNIVSGASGSAVFGRFFFYARGEYQHAPGHPAFTDTQRTLLAGLDANPVQPAEPVATTNRLYPVEAYAGVQLGQYALTFGKQSLWLGPGESAPLMVSDNADPMYMLRLTRTTPLVLPWIFKYLGPLRTEFLFAKLAGHQFPARPFFNLQKFSFHPTKNLELGFTRASLWAGVGHPFTLHSLVRNLTANGDTLALNDPGDRKAGFDFSYRIPGLRNWLTVYSDMYSDDDPSPIANPRRAAVNPGFYLSHFPGIPRLDLRAEVVSTQSLTAVDKGGMFLYYNGEYHDSNTNNGVLFGNPTGRDGKAYQAWTTYHFSAHTILQFAYRDVKTSRFFLPGGGTQTDLNARFVWQFRPQWSVDSSAQYERWVIPSLAVGAKHDILGSLQVTYHPNLVLHF